MGNGDPVPDPGSALFFSFKNGSFESGNIIKLSSFIKCLCQLVDRSALIPDINREQDCIFVNSSVIFIKLSPLYCSDRYLGQQFFYFFNRAKADRKGCSTSGSYTVFKSSLIAAAPAEFGQESGNHRVACSH